MAHHAQKFTGRWILAEIRSTTSPCSRLGITVTKRFGHACQRNRFKRLVREAFRLSCSQVSPPLDILIRPRTLALQAGMREIQEEMVAFIEKASEAVKK